MSYNIISLWFAIKIKISFLLQVVLCFPCNQFGHQENSSGDEIMNALRHVRPGNGFEPKGIMFDKVSQLMLLWWYYDKKIQFHESASCRGCPLKTLNLQCLPIASSEFLLHGL